MLEDVQKLRETLATLHAELDTVESGDPEVRRMLAGALQDIADKLRSRDGDALAAPPPADVSPSTGQLAESARILEVEHPTLAATLRGVVEALSRMGI
jgi:hypothetical protein